MRVRVSKKGERTTSARSAALLLCLPSGGKNQQFAANEASPSEASEHVEAEKTKSYKAILLRAGHVGVYSLMA